MQFRRQYQPLPINWLLFPDIIQKYISSIPQEYLREDKNKSNLLVIPEFEIFTFSQQVTLDSATEFIEFIQNSPETPNKIIITLQCFRDPQSIDAYRISPDFFEFFWSEKQVYVKLARISGQVGLKFLEDIKGILQLEPAKPEPENSDDEIGFLERSVFIAHSFDDTGRSYAFQLTKFLNLLGFEVITGEGYSPESVSAKVIRRLRAQEIVMAVVSERKDITWLIQETTGAEFSSKPLVLLIEEGVQFKSGILGDLEYIRFSKGKITDCFIPILEGLRDCFLKTLQDTDNTVYTEFHGKTLKKAALFRVVREIRVQKGKRQRLKKHSLREIGFEFS